MASNSISAFPKAHIINSSTCGGTVLGGAKGGSIDSGGRAPSNTNYFTKTHFSRVYIMTILQITKTNRDTEPIIPDFVKYTSRLFKMIKRIAID